MKGNYKGGITASQFMGQNTNTQIYPWLAGDKGTQPIVNQQQTTNELTKDIKKTADEQLHNWVDVASPSILDMNNQTKINTTIFNDQLTAAGVNISQNSTMVNSLSSIDKQISQMARQPSSSSSSGGGFAGMEGWQVINALHGGRASGFEGYVSSPTAMLVGEAGSEYVSITPHGRSGSAGQNIYVTVQGSVISERELMRIINSRLKSDMLGRNWTNFG